MLKDKISGKVNLGPDEGMIKPGDRGIALSKMNPMGRIKVNDVVMEGKSVQGYLNPKTEIEIIKITGSQAIVKPVK